jgi:hypothetical protein
MAQSTMEPKGYPARRWCMRLMMVHKCVTRTCRPPPQLALSLLPSSSYTGRPSSQATWVRELARCWVDEHSSWRYLLCQVAHGHRRRREVVAVRGALRTRPCACAVSRRDRERHEAV